MDIAEDVRKAAEAALRGGNIKAHMTGEATDPIEVISTAILAERERATAAERERAAEVAQAKGKYFGESSIGFAIASAIRSGETGK